MHYPLILNSYDTKVHLSSLHKLANWSKSDGEKILNLYVLMLKLSQIFALIGSFKDLNMPLAKFTHNLVLRETKIDSIESFKE